LHNHRYAFAATVTACLRCTTFLLRAVTRYAAPRTVLLPALLYDLAFCVTALRLLYVLCTGFCTPVTRSRCVTFTTFYVYTATFYAYCTRCFAFTDWRCATHTRLPHHPHVAVCDTPSAFFIWLVTHYAFACAFYVCGLPITLPAYTRLLRLYYAPRWLRVTTLITFTAYGCVALTRLRLPLRCLVYRHFTLPVADATLLRILTYHRITDV